MTSEKRSTTECWNCGIDYDPDKFHLRCPDCGEHYGNDPRFEELEKFATEIKDPECDIQPIELPSTSDINPIYVIGTDLTNDYTDGNSITIQGASGTTYNLISDTNVTTLSEDTDGEELIPFIDTEEAEEMLDIDEEETMRRQIAELPNPTNTEEDLDLPF